MPYAEAKQAAEKFVDSLGNYARMANVGPQVMKFRAELMREQGLDPEK